MSKGISPFAMMQHNGRFFCGAQDESDDHMIDPEMERMIAEPRFQNLRKPGISRAEAMAMMNAGNPQISGTPKNRAFSPLCKPSTKYLSIHAIAGCADAKMAKPMMLMAKAFQ